MSIESELIRIRAAKEELKTNLAVKGVETSEQDNITTLASKVADIPTGSGVNLPEDPSEDGSYYLSNTITTDEEGNSSNELGWNKEYFTSLDNLFINKRKNINELFFDNSNNQYILYNSLNKKINLFSPFLKENDRFNLRYFSNSNNLDSVTFTSFLSKSRNTTINFTCDGSWSSDIETNIFLIGHSEYLNLNFSKIFYNVVSLEGYFNRSFNFNGVCYGIHIEGKHNSWLSSTNIYGHGVHIEGYFDTTSNVNGIGIHLENQGNISGDYSHGEGYMSTTLGMYQHVQGKYNVPSTYKFADIVGNGTATDKLSNASALDWNGNLYLSGNVYVGCTEYTEGEDGEPIVENCGGTLLGGSSSSDIPDETEDVISSGLYNSPDEIIDGTELELKSVYRNGKWTRHWQLAEVAVR